MPFSKMKFAIAKILEKEGYLSRVGQETQGQRKILTIGLKYESGQPVLHHIRRVSRPSQRIYARTTELPTILSGLGLSVISTPNGLMTNREARQRRLGGEVICEVY